MSNIRENAIKITIYFGRLLRATIIFLLLIFFLFYFFIQLPFVQTYLGKELSTFLKKETGADLGIRAIDVDFFEFVKLEGIHLNDAGGDTILRAGQLSCRLNDFSLGSRRMKLELVQLRDAVFNLKNRKEGLNLNFLIDYFAGEKKPKANDQIDFQVDYGALDLWNARFTFFDYRAKKNYEGLNFKDVDVQEIYGRFSNLEINGDSIRVRVDGLRAAEKCGLEICSLSADVIVSPFGIHCDSLDLRMAGTRAKGKYSMETAGWSDYEDYLNKVYMRALLKDSSSITLSDLACFVPQFSTLQRKIDLSGNFRGTVNSLHGSKVGIQSLSKTIFQGDFSLEGLPDVRNTYVHFDIKKLQTSAEDLAQINLSGFDLPSKLSIPSNIYSLGTIRFKGKIDGFLNDVALFGDINSALGNLSVDIGVQSNPEKIYKVAYHGKVKTDGFGLGAFIKVNEIKNISCGVELKGKGLDLDHLFASVNGDIHSIGINQYNYKSINVKGDFENKIFNGKLECRDPNSDFDFYGSVNMTQKIPNLDFIATINRFDLKSTGWVNSDSSLVFSSQVAINLAGSSLDYISGRINFDDSHLQRGSKKFALSVFDLQLNQEKADKDIRIHSGLADVEIKGKYNISTLYSTLQRFGHHYFPTFITNPKSINSDEFVLKVKFKKYNAFKDLLIPELELEPGATFLAEFVGNKNELNAELNASIVKYSGLKFQNITWDIGTREGDILGGCKIQKINVTDSVSFQNFEMTTHSFDQTSGLNFNWNNPGPKKNSGNFSGKFSFDQKHVESCIDTFQIYLKDTLWILDDQNYISLDTNGRIEVQNVVFKNRNQKIDLDGIISRNPKEQLALEIENFNLEDLNPFLSTQKVKLDGKLSGLASISNVYKNVVFSTALDFTSLSINEQLIGSGELNNFYDLSKDVISLHGFFNQEMIEGISDESLKNIQFSGYYFPKHQYDALDIEFNLRNINLKIAQPYLKGILTIDKGAISGGLKVTGELNKPKLNGKLHFENVKNLKIDYLNVSYDVIGDVIVEQDRLAFEPIYLHDPSKNKAILWGNIFHDNFKNFKYDFDIGMTKFLCLNTSMLNNESYYGKAFASGNVGVYGYESSVNMELNLKTEKGTVFYIPLSGPNEVSENAFIHFIKRDTIDDNNENDLSGIHMNFNLEATPDAEVQLIFDAKAGDIIKAHGSGNLGMEISNKGKFEMSGVYKIRDGSYLFTLENIINKKFDIDENSTIKWSGDPYNADINITAKYKQRASLSPFFQSINTNQNSNTVAAGSTADSGPENSDVNKRYPIECLLFMKGKLLEPDIHFGIAMPTVSEAMRQQALAYINTEQELNRQVFSLLLLKSFVRPLALSSNSGVDASGAVGANATEMLSNQVSNFLSGLSSDVNVGVNYRPGTALSNEELDLALSTQLLNDRLTIDGNFGVNNNSQNKTSNLIGDLNVDYKLNEDGKLRIKAFNRSNDNYQIAAQGGQFTQGVGVFYREDFETVGELTERYQDYLRRFIRKLKGKKSS